jgi:hypothetical protein
MSFSFHPEAESEFDAARDFYDERELGLGEDFLNEVRATIGRNRRTSNLLAALFSSDASVPV